MSALARQWVNGGAPNGAKYHYDFSYDFSKRLAAADYSEAGPTPNYDLSQVRYDANGNISRLVRNDDAGAIIDALDYQYGKNNQLLAIVENQPPSAVTWDAENRAYTYDANGNLTSVTTDSASSVDFIQYDDRNLPLLLVLANGAEVIYQYNSDGQRICKRTDSLAPEHYIMDAALTVGVADSSLKYWNLLANGVAGRAEAGGGKYYYLKDHLGSTRSVVDQAGFVQESYDYYPFGLYMPGRTMMSGLGTKEHFTGKERDTETGWDYFGARYYDAVVGRWLSTDAFADKYPSLTPYHYTLNNPVRFIDLNGDSTFVNANDDGTYTVAGVNLSGDDNDTGVFVRGEDGNLTMVGQSVTTHSFVNDAGNAVVGAVIDPSSTEGQNFIDGLIATDPGLISYMLNATGRETFDFKTNKIDQRPPGITEEQYKYRGSVTANGTFGSARDFGNIGAGIVAGRAGLTWIGARIGFDALESLQKKSITSEGTTTQKAQRVGYEIGRKLIKYAGFIVR